MRTKIFPMLLTGLAIALGLLLTLQVIQNMRSPSPDAANSPDITEASQADLNKTVQPIIFNTSREENGRLELSGSSEPGSVIVVYDGLQNLGQWRADESGQWSVSVSVEDDSFQMIDLIGYDQDGGTIRSDETLIRLAGPPPTEDGSGVANARSLLLMTAPGGPSRIIQTPFDTPLQDKSLSLGPVDYDDSGGIILSGSAEPNALIRIVANDIFIGEGQAGPDGRWFFIAAEALSYGSYDLRVSQISGENETAFISVPLTRQRTEDTDDNLFSGDETLRFNYQPTQWQITRILKGGGHQHTAIYGGEVDVADATSPPD